MSGTVEDYQNTQRFRVYCGIVEGTIGDQTFAHYSYEEVSGYLLINRQAQDIDQKEELITRMFSSTYNELPNV